MLAVGATTCGVPPVLRTAALDALVARAAGADPRVLVLILGEPGVGKDVLARLIHTDSSRRLYPFIKMNCALEPVDRCEAELFGVEHGASPQAIRRRLGALEFANHGAKITIPPLRQRPDEICSFASFFVEQFNRQYQRRADLCPDTVAKLRDHSWPGNLRELGETVRRLVVSGAHRVFE